MSGVELDSLISQVKDLLPDLGEGFILACLEHYHYDSEQVINNILEQRLAPALSQLDRSLDRWEMVGGSSRGPAASGWGLSPCLLLLFSSQPQDPACWRRDQPFTLMPALGKKKKPEGLPGGSPTQRGRECGKLGPLLYRGTATDY